MKKKNICLGLVLILLVSLFAGGCGKKQEESSKKDELPGTEEIQTTEIETDEQATVEEVEELNSAELKMSPGQEYQLSVKNSTGAIEWSTENEDVATVSDSGNVTAVADGTTSIIASVDKKNLECIITVEEGVTEVESVAPVDSKNEKASSASKGEIVPAGNVENTSNSSSGSSSSSGQKAPSNSSSTASQAGETLPAGNSSTSSSTIQPSTGGGSPTTQPSTGGESSTTQPSTPEPTPCSHNYVWVTSKDATTSSEGLKEHKCSKCGDVDATESIPKLTLETDWVYSGNTRTKTMADGTVFTETKVDTSAGSVWGYYDDTAARQMFDAVVRMQGQQAGWAPATWGEDLVAQAKAQVANYAAAGNNSTKFHMNAGGMPNVDDNKTRITIFDSYGCANAIACFVVDSRSGHEQFTYGEDWRSYFGTYYASCA